MIGRRATGAIAALALGSVAACAGVGTGSSGQLAESSERVWVCIPQPKDARATLGVDVTENTSSTDLVVTAVRLTHPRGMKMVGAKVMFIPKGSTQTLVGFRRGWPPRLGAREGEVRRAMGRSPDAVGTVLPGDDPQTIAVVVGVEVAAGGRSGPIQVDYRDELGATHTWTGPTRFKTAATECRSGDTDY